MSTCIDDLTAPPLCVDCSASLTAKELSHGREGFGHQGRCCDCYDRSFTDKLAKRKRDR